MSHHVVEVRGLAYTYQDGTAALKDVGFTIPHGESVAVVGPNGSGKSTLLLQFSGCLLPTRGAVRIGDHLLSAATVAGVRRAVGMVFQDPDDQLFMPTVLEDVAFGPLHAGMQPADAERMAMGALERVGMAHLRDRPPYRLSAGQKRAVAIATVLAMEPDILVMDEPSTNLDPRGRRRLVGLLRSFPHTKIIATHDLELAVEVCPRIIVLDDGCVVAQGVTREVLDDEALMLAHGLERPHILRHPHPHDPA